MEKTPFWETKWDGPWCIGAMVLGTAIGVLTDVTLAQGLVIAILYGVTYSLLSARRDRRRKTEAEEAKIAELVEAGNALPDDAHLMGTHIELSPNVRRALAEGPAGVDLTEDEQQTYKVAKVQSKVGADADPYGPDWSKP